VPGNGHLLHGSECNRGTGCGKTARPGLYGGRRVTGVPTVAPHHPDGLDQVPFQGAAPIVIGAVGNARSAATADVVNQDINPAKGRDGGLDEPCRFLGFADIGRVSGDVHAARA